jgi:hypothetical protein
MGEVRMDLLRALADRAVGRALGFAGLGVGTTMVALSFDLALSLRVGADMTALVCLALACSAWGAPRRDVRRTELWAMLAEVDGELTRSLPRARAQVLLSGVLRESLLRHADLVGVAAVALWAVACGATLVGALSRSG